MFRDKGVKPYKNQKCTEWFDLSSSDQDESWKELRKTVKESGAGLTIFKEGWTIALPKETK